MHLQQAISTPDLSQTKYDLGEEIGRGGMGTVYLAQDRELGRKVAVKVLNSIESSEDGAARMYTEARTLAYLSIQALFQYMTPELSPTDAFTTP